MRSICAGKNTAQTDEEKQRERQRNEREQKNAEVEAQHLKVRIDLFEISCFFLNYTYIYVFCRSGVNSKKKPHCIFVEVSFLKSTPIQCVM